MRGTINAPGNIGGFIGPYRRAVNDVLANSRNGSSHCRPKYRAAGLPACLLLSLVLQVAATPNTTPGVTSTGRNRQMSQKCQHARDLGNAARRPASGMNYKAKEDVNKTRRSRGMIAMAKVIRQFPSNQLGDEAVLGVHESGSRAVRHHVTDSLRRLGSGHDGDELYPGIR